MASEPLLSRAPFGYGAWLAVANLLLTALLCGATYGSLHISMAADLARAREAAQNLADSVAAELGAELRLVDNALLTLRRHVRIDPVDRVPMASPGLHAELQEQQKLAPFVAAIGVIAADGRLLHDSQDGPAAMVAEQAYFKAALRTDGLVVAGPVRSGAGGRWHLVLARRLDGPDGRPQGVLVAEIASGHFKALFGHLSLGAGGAISLRTDAARLVARYSQADPDGEAGLGTSTVSLELQQALARHEPFGSYRTVTAIDGIDRINAYRRVPGYGLVLLAGLSTRDYVTPWVGEAQRQWSFTTGVLLLLWGGSALIYRQHWRERLARLRADRLAREQGQAHESERRLKEQVQAMAAELSDLYDNAPCAYYSLDGQGRFSRVNAVMCQWLACSREALLAGRGLVEFLDDASAARFRHSFPSFIARGEIGPLEFDLVGADGQRRHVSVRASAIRDAAGAFVCSRSVMYDITALDHTRSELRQLTLEQGAMLANDLVGILRLRDRRIVWSNPASERMFGYGPGQLNGLEARQLYPSEAAYQSFGQQAYDALAVGGRFRAQVELRTRDGRPVVVDVSGSRLPGDTAEYLWMSLDITEMRRQHERIEFVAFHDGLTGLANRALMMDRLHLSIERCRRTREPLVVCFLDLDGFKRVNDLHGHAAGDQLLQEIARRLASQVRAHDTVARVGGDEFVILMSSPCSAVETDEAIQRLRREVAEPVRLADGEVVQVRASIGQACWPRDGDDEDSLLNAADRAMYLDKMAARPRGDG